MFEKEKNFLIEFGILAESTARHSRPQRARAACAAQPTGATTQRIHGRAPRSGSKLDPIAPDPPR
jgi:hypothetical protein